LALLRFSPHVSPELSLYSGPLFPPSFFFRVPIGNLNLLCPDCLSAVFFFSLSLLFIRLVATRGSFFSRFYSLNSSVSYSRDFAAPFPSSFHVNKIGSPFSFPRFNTFVDSTILQVKFLFLPSLGSLDDYISVLRTIGQMPCPPSFSGAEVRDRTLSSLFLSPFRVLAARKPTARFDLRSFFLDS